MPTPRLLPQQQTFKEAIAFHRSRVPISDAALAELSNEAKNRAFWIAGLARQASAVEAHRLIDEAIKNGTTDALFRAEFTKLLAENGGSVLPFARQNLIFGTNVGLAYSAGRMKQLMDPDVLAERPILMYPLGPHDSRTTAICISLEGFMAEATSSVWPHIAPPNHFKERHLKLLSLTREQAAERGDVWQDQDGINYPVVNGQQMLPDPGFDQPAAMLASDARNLAQEFEQLVTERAAKVPADYELEAIGEMPDDAAIAVPDLAPADAEEAWQTLRDDLKFDDALDSTITPDLFGDGAIVNRESYDAIFGDTPELATLLPRLLTEATEVWFVPFETEQGVTVVKRYIGAFSDGESVIYLWADQSPSGWIARGGTATATEIETLRRGYLASTRVPRKAAKAA